MIITRILGNSFYRFFNAWKRSKEIKGVIIAILLILMISTLFSIKINTALASGLLYQTGFENFTTGIIDTQENWSNSAQIDLITETEAHTGNKSVVLPSNSSWWLKDLYSPAVDQTQSQKFSLWVKVAIVGRPLSIIFAGSYESLIIIEPTIPVDDNWHYVQAFFDIGVGENTYGSRVDNGAWSTTTDIGYPAYYYIDKVLLRNYEKLNYVYIDDFYFGDYEKIIPSAYFTSPEQDAYISTSPLSIQIAYSNFTTEFEKIILSGCSETTPQCIVPQVKDITDPSGSKSFIIDQGITKGIWNFSLIIKDANGDIFLPSEFEALSLDFLLNYDLGESIILPEAPEAPELKDPYIYYFENTEYATTTAIFNSLTSSFGAGFIWIYNLLDIFDYFQLKTDIGQNIGEAISVSRAYVENLNSFFNLPIVEMFFLYIAVLLIVGILRFIKYIRNLLPFI